MLPVTDRSLDLVTLFSNYRRRVSGQETEWFWRIGSTVGGYLGGDEEQEAQCAGSAVDGLEPEGLAGRDVVGLDDLSVGDGEAGLSLEE